MKNTKFVIIIVVCVCVILGGYYYLTNRNNAKEEENITLTEIQELTTKNLDKNFPATPREVVKLYNRIITCFYNDEGSVTYEVADWPRREFFDEIKQTYITTKIFANIFILFPDCQAKWWIWDVGTDHRASVQLDERSLASGEYPYCILKPPFPADRSASAPRPCAGRSGAE